MLWPCRQGRSASAISFVRITLVCIACVQLVADLGAVVESLGADGKDQLALLVDLMDVRGWPACLPSASSLALTWPVYKRTCLTHFGD